MDLQSLLGVLVADTMLNMGIGKLRLMMRVSGLDIAASSWNALEGRCLPLACPGLGALARCR